MIATRMGPTRRITLLSFIAPLTALSIGQQQEPNNRRTIPDKDPDEDVRLPNGKSQKDEISKRAHADALKDVESLIRMAEDLRDELKHSGEFVVSLSSLRKTEDIEKLARRIRGKLKA
jgi:hypothetical protein